jgi:hypothetical protein
MEGGAVAGGAPVSLPAELFAFPLLFSRHSDAGGICQSIKVGVPDSES